MEPTQTNMSPDTSTLAPQPVVKPSEPKYWKRRLIASSIVFAVLMLFFVFLSKMANEDFGLYYAVGSFVIAFAVSFVFYFVYWIISIIGRKFGMPYPVILWIIFAATVFFGAYTVVSNRVEQNSTLSPGESVVLPPGADLSELPSYIQIDTRDIRTLPDGTKIIPKGSIRFVMSYDDCLKTEDIDAMKGCANKYVIERNNPALCESLIRPVVGLVSDREISIMRDECVSVYAVVNKKPEICNSIKNQFVGSSCFDGIVAQVKDIDECKKTFKAAADIIGYCENAVKKESGIKQ
jgi:hypothetical protein